MSFNNSWLRGLFRMRNNAEDFSAAGAADKTLERAINPGKYARFNRLSFAKTRMGS